MMKSGAGRKSIKFLKAFCKGEIKPIEFDYHRLILGLIINCAHIIFFNKPDSFIVKSNEKLRNTPGKFD